MGRWEPNAGDRLREAALELFHEQGYDRTTVEEIAARAGLTERTFFRYYTDKREVLFAGAAALQESIVASIKAAPASTTPLDAADAAFAGTSEMFEARRALARKRHELILAHRELQERELIKLASLGAAIAETVHGRGIGRPAASLIGDTAMAIFMNAFVRWVTDTKKHDLAHHMRATYADLRLATA